MLSEREKERDVESKKRKKSWEGGGRGEEEKKQPKHRKRVRERERKRGKRGFTRQSLVGSQVHRSVRWEHTVCTPVQTSWPPLPASVSASPSDTPTHSQRWRGECSSVWSYTHALPAKVRDVRKWDKKVEKKLQKDKVKYEISIYKRSSNSYL